MNTPHRLQQIFDALISTFETLKQDPVDSGLPTQAYLVLRQYVHWSEIETLGRRLREPVFPALLLNYGEGGARVKGGTQAEYASLGETEDHQTFALLALIKETRTTPAPLGDQTSDMIFSVERLINGAHDLGVEGVVDVRVDDVPAGSEGRASAIAGTPLDVIVFKIVVTHVYRSTNFA